MHWIVFEVLLLLGDEDEADLGEILATSLKEVVLYINREIQASINSSIN